MDRRPPTHTPPRGRSPATLTATDSEGNSATRTGVVQIADTLAPGVLSFDMTNRVFAVGPRATPLTAKRRRVPRGTKFRFNVTEAASVRDHDPAGPARPPPARAVP